MDYIVFDLEWNQPANDRELVTQPVYLDGEIIEIGAVKLDGSFRTVDERRFFVKPRYYEKMHRKIASLTGISDRQLQQEGKPFPEVCRDFLQWCGEDFGFFTWSDSDLPVLIDNMQLWGMDVSHLPQCFDVQRMFDRELMRSSRQYSLDGALEALGIRGDKAHDALNDSRNTVLICDRLELETYASEYGAFVFADTPILRTFESTAQILSDPQVLEIPCPWCGETMTCRDFVSLPGHRYAAMADCAEEDEFLMQIQIFPCPGGYRIRRLLYEMSDDLWDQYQDRLEQQATAGA